MIDAIIPTYNRANSLKQVMDSYVVQENLGHIIVVDDGSTDHLPQSIKELQDKYPGKIIYHRLETKQGLPAARNVGISLSDAEWIFMGEDDVLLPSDHFAVLMRKARELNADLISGRRIYLHTNETIEHAIEMANKDKAPVFIKTPFEGYFERYVEKAENVPYLHSNALMRRTVFEKVLYDPGYIGNAFREELDFFLRATAAGFMLWLIPNTLCFHLKNTVHNSTGGSRKNRIKYEAQVWYNTIRCFLKNRTIMKKLFGIKNIYWFTLSSLLARYSYALRRRISWVWYGKK